MREEERLSAGRQLDIVYYNHGQETVFGRQFSVWVQVYLDSDAKRNLASAHPCFIESIV